MICSDGSKNSFLGPTNRHHRCSLNLSPTLYPTRPRCTRTYAKLPAPWYAQRCHPPTLVGHMVLSILGRTTAQERRAERLQKAKDRSEIQLDCPSYESSRLANLLLHSASRPPPLLPPEKSPVWSLYFSRSRHARSGQRGYPGIQIPGRRAQRGGSDIRMRIRRIEDSPFARVASLRALHAPPPGPGPPAASASGRTTSSVVYTILPRCACL